MKEFAYTRAATVQDAVAVLNDIPGARYLAGGTNLVDLMKAGVEQPTWLVDLQDLRRHEQTLQQKGTRVGLSGDFW